MTSRRRLTRPRSRREATAARHVTVAAVFVLLITAVTYLAFVRGLPFQSSYEIRGVFADVNQLRQGSDVRIAGITIGTVASVTPGSGATAIATLEITDRRVPIHTDATFSIRPRLVLEGNDYVAVNPGTRAAPLLRSGGTLGLGHTNEAVQLDQVLSALTSPTRQALTGSIANLASALGSGSRSRSRSGQSPAPGTAGFHGLRDGARQLDGALGSFTAVLSAAQGTGPGELSRSVGSSGDLTAQLATNPPALADLVTSFDRTMNALASQSRALQASVSGIDGLMRSAPADLSAINPALPRLTSFAEDLRPALAVAPGPLRDFDDLLGQLAALSRPAALPSLVRNLRPVTTNLPLLEQQLGALFPLVTSASTCVSRNIVPTMNMTAPDGANSTGQPIWKDLVHAFASYSGLASDFDGNGSTIRLGVAIGEYSVTGAIPGLGNVVGVSPKIEGLNPLWLGYGVNPPWRPDQPCQQQSLPNLGADTSTVQPSNLHYGPLALPTGQEAALVKGLYGTAAQRGALLQSLLRSLGAGRAASTRPRNAHGVAGSAPVATPRPTKPPGAAQPASPGQGHTGATGLVGPLSSAVSPILGGAIKGVAGLLHGLLGLGRGG
jgi:phospholipid/cholesterol/gamma-HCH transport system substrate-binding protein